MGSTFTAKRSYHSEPDVGSILDLEVCCREPFDLGGVSNEGFAKLGPEGRCQLGATRTLVNFLLPVHWCIGFFRNQSNRPGISMLIGRVPRS